MSDENQWTPREVVAEYCKKDSIVDAGNLLWAAKKLEQQVERLEKENEALKDQIKEACAGRDYWRKTKLENTELKALCWELVEHYGEQKALPKLENIVKKARKYLSK